MDCAVIGWYALTAPLCQTVERGVPVIEMEYDASFCPQCDRWLEDECRDPRVASARMAGGEIRHSVARL